MKPEQLLSLAREQGLTLRADGGNLRVRGPRQVVITWKPKIEANKDELLALLRGEVQGAGSRTPTQSYACSRCGGYFGEDDLTWLGAGSVGELVCQSCWPGRGPSASSR